MKIDELELPARAKTMLKNGGITTVDELCAVNSFIILAHPNCGRKTLNSIQQALQKRGRALDAPYPPTPFAESVLEKFRTVNRARGGLSE